MEKRRDSSLEAGIFFERKDAEREEKVFSPYPSIEELRKLVAMSPMGFSRSRGSKQKSSLERIVSTQELTLETLEDQVDK